MSPETCTFELPDPAATTIFGHHLAGLLFPGAVIALIGPLGAGKTIWFVPSPKDWACRQQGGKQSYFRVDPGVPGPLADLSLRRLPPATDAEFLDLGAYEYFDGSGVCLVEWADRVRGCLPADHLCIVLEPTGETTRRVAIRAYGDRYARMARELPLHFQSKTG